MQPFDYCSGTIRVLPADRPTAESRTTTSQSQRFALPVRSPRPLQCQPAPRTHRAAVRHPLPLTASAAEEHCLCGTSLDYRTPGNRFQPPITPIQRTPQCSGVTAAPAPAAPAALRIPRPFSVRAAPLRSGANAERARPAGTGSKPRASHLLSNDKC